MRANSLVKLVTMGVVALLLAALPLLGACAKEVVKEVPVEKVVEKEVVREVPVEKVVEKEVVKEIPVEKVVVKEVMPKLNIALSLGTTSIGSSGYSVGIALARLTEKYGGITLTPEAVNGSNAIVANMLAGEQEVGIISADVVWNAARGIEPFKQKAPLRTLMNGHELIYHLLTLNPSIKTLKDLKGRVVMWQNPAAFTHQTLGQEMVDYCIKTYGWSEKDITSVVRKSTGVAVSSIKEGSVDVISTLAKGGADLVELAITNKGKFAVVPFTDDLIETMVTKHRMFGRSVIPKGLYEGYPPEDIPAVGLTTDVIAKDDVPEEAVYQMVKAVFEHLDEFQEIAPGSIAAEYTLKRAVSLPLVPFHTGAIRYYKEKGVWTPALAEKQKQLLEEVR